MLFAGILIFIKNICEVIDFNMEHEKPYGGITPSAVALGNFDGVHIGHRAIIDAAKREAENSAVDTCLTFTAAPNRAQRRCSPHLSNASAARRRLR